MLAGARQRARLLTVLALLARRLRRRPRRRRARRPLRRPCHRPRRHRVRGSRVRRRRARRRLLLVRRWGRGRFSNLANSSFINVRGESRTLRSCCSRILLLFCCYCIQHFNTVQSPTFISPIREVETRILLLELVGQHHRSIVYTDPRGRSAVSNPILRYNNKYRRHWRCGVWGVTLSRLSSTSQRICALSTHAAHSHPSLGGSVCACTASAARAPPSHLAAVASPLSNWPAPPPSRPRHRLPPCSRACSRSH